MLELISAEPFLLVDRNSRFLAELFPVETQEQARACIADQRQKYLDASHVVHAMALGKTAGILGCSDDGEPAGTAGRPVLEVLKGSRLSGVILTVTRWFGGTKLGTGGLVHAYSGAAKGVLESAVTREQVPMSELSFGLSYAILEPGKRFLQDAGFAIATEEYDGDGAHITGTIPTEDLPPLARNLQDLSRGKVNLLPTS